MNSTRSFHIQCLARLAHFLPLQIIRPFESFIINFLPFPTNNLPPVFILGLPRSGTTLTYQCFLNSFHFSYLSNVSHFFYRIPFLSCLISNFLVIFTNYRSTFVSSKGFVSGPLGPAEGLHFWRYWMAATLYQSPIQNSELNTTRIIYLKKVFSALSPCYGPFLSAYLGHLLCLDKLFNFFPSAFYIRIHRNPLLVALSIKSCFDKEESSWFSLMPSECNNLENQSIYMKIASQVYWLSKRLSYQPPNINFFDVCFEDLCENPSQVMLRFYSYCKSQGVDLALKNPPPVNFSQKSLDSYHVSDVREMKKCLLFLIQKHGELQFLRESSLT